MMLKKILKNYFYHDGAVAAIIVAFMIPAIMASAGIAVDLAAAYNAKNRLGNALDKAVLAVGSSTGTTKELTDRMNAFFNANYPSGKYGAPFDVTLSVQGSVMTVNASTRVPTAFMSLFGFKNIDVTASSTVVRELAGIEAVLVLDTTGSMAGNNIGALKTASTNFINTMFTKVTDQKYLRIGIVPWSDAVNVGPYGLGLDLNGNAYGTPFVDRPANDPYVTPASDIKYGSANVDWQSCVIERDNASALTDAPSPPNWPMYRYPAGACKTYNCLTYNCAQYDCAAYNCAQYNCTAYNCTQYDCAQYNCKTCSSGKVSKGVCTTKGATCKTYDTTCLKAGNTCLQQGTCKTYGNTCLQQGTCKTNGNTCLQQGTTCTQYGNTCVEHSGDPNSNCPTSPIQPLTNNQATLLNVIKNLPTQGNTYSNIGMVWGWRVISPDPPFTEAAAYDDSKWSKTVILMTDGDNTINTVLSGEGLYKAAGTSMTPTDQNNKFEQVCTNMKAKGIRIYTITFQSAINAATKKFYHDCATSPSMYYDAPSNQSLIDAFNAIAQQLSQLHITK